VQKSTKFDPYFLVYGRRAQAKVEGFSQEDIQCRIRLLEKLTQQRETAKVNSENAKAKQKEFFDKSHTELNWNIGDKVLMINLRRRGRKGDKLAKG
jgi:hypothetical protein